jgi:type VI secretion system secreted protein Hcp
VAVDFFLNIDGIQGESTDPAHKGEIQLESWSWGESNAIAAAPAGGGGTGRAQFSDFNFAAMTSKASPQLIEACATGQHIKTALLSCRRTTGKTAEDFLTFTFTDVAVASFETGGAGGSANLTDSVSLAFAQFHVTYKSQNPDGTLGTPVAAGFNVATNQKV